LFLPVNCSLKHVLAKMSLAGTRRVTHLTAGEAQVGLATHLA